MQALVVIFAVLALAGIIQLTPIRHKLGWHLGWRDLFVLTGTFVRVNLVRVSSASKATLDKINLASSLSLKRYFTNLQLRRRLQYQQTIAAQTEYASREHEVLASAVRRKREYIDRELLRAQNWHDAFVGVLTYLEALRKVSGFLEEGPDQDLRKHLEACHRLLVPEQNGSQEQPEAAKTS